MICIPLDGISPDPFFMVHHFALYSILYTITHIKKYLNPNHYTHTNIHKVAPNYLIWSWANGFTGDAHSKVEGTKGPYCCLCQRILTILKNLSLWNKNIFLKNQPKNNRTIEESLWSVIWFSHTCAWSKVDLLNILDFCSCFHKRGSNL